VPEGADGEAADPERKGRRHDADPVHDDVRLRGKGREGDSREDTGEDEEERAERAAAVLRAHGATLIGTRTA
jgi:hypothetical protein